MIEFLAESVIVFLLSIVVFSIVLAIVVRLGWLPVEPDIRRKVDKLFFWMKNEN